MQMTLYLVCFDLKKEFQLQVAEIAYWLNFLNSSLPLPPPPISPNPNWRVFLVGTRSDLQDPTSSKVQARQLAQWKRKFQSLPLFDEIFSVSSINSDGVQHLISTLERVCNMIFTSHALEIPAVFSRTLDIIQQQTKGSSLIKTEELYAQFGEEMESDLFSIMLQYFHQIGHIVSLRGALICTEPQRIPKIAATFISPEEVRANLLLEKDVQILREKNILSLLNIEGTASQRYDSINNGAILIMYFKKPEG